MFLGGWGCLVIGGNDFVDSSLELARNTSQRVQVASIQGLWSPKAIQAMLEPES